MTTIIAQDLTNMPPKKFVMENFDLKKTKVEEVIKKIALDPTINLNLKESDVKLWDPVERKLIKKGTIGAVYPDFKKTGRVWFTKGAIAIQSNGHDTLQLDKKVWGKDKDLDEKDLQLSQKDMEDILYKQLGKKKDTVHFLDARKKMVKDPKTTIKNAILDSKGVGDLIVQFYYGTLAKEQDGSQVFFFPNLDCHNSTVDDYKKEIRDKIGKEVDLQDIDILDAKTKDKITDNKAKAGKLGEVFFKMKKIIAREINGGKEIEFLGKHAESMELDDIKKLITDKLNVPVDQVLLCNRKSEEVKHEKGVFVEKAFMFESLTCSQKIVWYKNKVTSKIPDNSLQIVGIDYEADHSQAQIKAGNIKNNDMELSEEIDLWQIEFDLKQLWEFKKGNMGTSKQITKEQYEQGKKQLEDSRDDINKRRKERKRSSRHMLKALTFGVDKTEEEYRLELFKKKRQFILERAKVRKDAVELNFPFTKQQDNFVHNYKRTTPNWVIDLMFQYYTLNDIPRVVRAFNNFEQFTMAEGQKQTAAQDKKIGDQYHLDPMSFYGTPDFDIQKMPDGTIKDFLLCLEEELKTGEHFDNPGLAQNDSKRFLPDFTTFKFKLHNKKGDKEKKITIKIKDPSVMTIRDLKSYLLRETKGKPFIFRFDIENDKKVSDLIELQRAYHEANKPIRMKNPKEKPVKDDPKKPWCPWVLAGSENRFDVYQDYKYFDLSLSYSNDLSKIQEEEYTEAFHKYSNSEDEISALDDKKEIGYGTETKLGEVYYALTNAQLTKKEITDDFKPKDGKVSLKNFITVFKRKCDEKLPTILLKGVTYNTNLFNKKMSKAEKIAQIFQEEFKIKIAGKAEIQPNAFTYPLKQNDPEKPDYDKKIAMDQILIITEDQRTFPLLHCYDKNFSLKDLGITRYSKLQYKVVRQGDVLNTLRGSVKRDFFKLENKPLPKKDDSKQMKNLKKQLMRSMGGVGQKIQYMAAGKIIYEIPDYLRAPFIQEANTGEKAGDEKQETITFEKEMTELDVPVSDAKDQIILQIHSKPNSEKDREELEDPKTKYMDQDQKMNLLNKEKRPKGATGDCYLDLNNFENHQIERKHLQFEISYTVEYNPYAEYLIENPKCSDETVLKLKNEKKSKKWIMQDGVSMSVYQYIVRTKVTGKQEEEFYKNKQEGHTLVRNEEYIAPKASEDNGAGAGAETEAIVEAKDDDSYGKENDNPYGEENEGGEREDPYGKEDDDDPYGDQNEGGESEDDPYGKESDDPYGEENDDPNGNEQGNDDPAQAAPQQADPEPSLGQTVITISDTDTNLHIKIELVNVIAMQIDDTGLKTLNLSKGKLQKTKRWKFVEYRENVSFVGDLAKYIRVSDVFDDVLKKKLQKAMRESDDQSEAYQREKEEEIQDKEIRDEVMRQNLYFLHEKKLVPNQLGTTLIRNKLTSGLKILVGLRQNLHRTPSYIVRAEDTYLVNEMRAFIYREKGSSGMAKTLQTEIMNILDNDETFNNNITKSFQKDWKSRDNSGQTMEKRQKDSTQYKEEREAIVKTLKQIIQDENDGKELQNVETFKSLLRMYSKNIMFRAVNKIMMDATFGNIHTYLRAIFQLNVKYGKQLTYQEFHKPVYRGINLDQYQMLDYEPNSVKQWCSFTACSTSLKVAYGQSYKPYDLVQCQDKDIKKYLSTVKVNGNKIPDYLQDSIIQDPEKLPSKDQDLVIFKVFICKDNFESDETKAARSNIELKNENENDPNEVLLLPFFTFRVAHIEETRNKLTVYLPDHNDKETKNEGKITIVTLMEVPFQKMVKEIPHQILVTLDSLIMSDSFHKSVGQTKLSSKVAEAPQFFPDIISDVNNEKYSEFFDRMMNNIRSTVRTVMVVQCKFGMDFVQQFYNGLNVPSNVKRIFVFIPPSSSEKKEDESRTKVTWQQVDELIEQVKKVTKVLKTPGIRWSGDPLDRIAYEALEKEGRENEYSGPICKDTDSYIVNVNKILKDTTDPQELIDAAYYLLIEVCDKTRLNEAELKERLDQEVHQNEEKRQAERKSQREKEFDLNKQAIEKLRADGKNEDQIMEEARIQGRNKADERRKKYKEAELKKKKDDEDAKDDPDKQWQNKDEEVEKEYVERRAKERKQKDEDNKKLEEKAKKDKEKREEEEKKAKERK